MDSEVTAQVTSLGEAVSGGNTVHRGYRSEFGGDDDTLVPSLDSGLGKPSLGKIWVDMYLGSGKENPSMTSRVARLEEDMIEQKSTSKRQEALAWSILVSVIMVLLAVVFKR